MEGRKLADLEFQKDKKALKISSKSSPHNNVEKGSIVHSMDQVLCPSNPTRAIAV